MCTYSIGTGDSMDSHLSRIHLCTNYHYVLCVLSLVTSLSCGGLGVKF